HVAHTGPNDEHLLGKVTVNGHQVDIVSKGGIINGKLVASIPIGPQWFNAGGKFLLGADRLGRDDAVRLLFGGRNSVSVGIGSSPTTSCSRLRSRFAGPAGRIRPRLGASCSRRYRTSSSTDRCSRSRQASRSSSPYCR